MTGRDANKSSGDGTRPTTSGGVDNIGAGEKFSSERTAAGDEVSGPAPHERMQGKRSDVEGSRHDDSDPFYLHENLGQPTNREPDPAPKDMPANQPKDVPARQPDGS